MKNFEEMLKEMTVSGDVPATKEPTGKPKNKTLVLKRLQHCTECNSIYWETCQCKKG